MAGPVGTALSALRYPVALVGAVVAAVAIFYGMQLLVSELEGELKDRIKSPPIQMVRVKKSAPVQEKKRELPTKPKMAEEPPPPDMDMTDPGAPSGADAVAISAPTPQTNVKMTGTGLGGMAVGDAAATPLVRVNPELPHRARSEGVEGVVVVRFDIGPTGKVRNVKVVEENPTGYGFAKAALRAVKRWKYRPKVVDGKPLIQSGVETAFNFTIKKK